jgi:hypothetical protein
MPTPGHLDIQLPPLRDIPEVDGSKRGRRACRHLATTVALAGRSRTSTFRTRSYWVRNWHQGHPEGMGKIVPKPASCSLVHRLFMLAATPSTADASGYVIRPSPNVFVRRIFCQEDYGSLLTDSNL